MSDNDDYDEERDDGRCYLCGARHPRCSGTAFEEFTVCPQCAPAVNALFEHECELLPLLARVSVGLREERARLQARPRRPEARIDKLNAMIEAIEEPGREGAAWAPFDEYGDGAFCVMKMDELDHFKSDRQAAHYVARRLGRAMAYPNGY